MAHECPKKNEIKVCSICAGREHTWKMCEMGDRKRMKSMETTEISKKRIPRTPRKRKTKEGRTK